MGASVVTTGSGALAPTEWSLSIDDDGHRTYSVTLLVKADTFVEGPLAVSQATGMPVIGTAYSVGGESDSYALRTAFLETKVHKQTDSSKNYYWDAKIKYTTRPFERCPDDATGNPLLEPAKISGGFNKYTEEVTTDRHGQRLLFSNLQIPHGPQVEFDRGRAAVRVVQNQQTLGLAALVAMVDTVNDAAMWGFSPRCVKLSNATWERIIQTTGDCVYYYRVTYDFETDYDTFDRDLVQAGTMVLSGKYATSGANEGSWIDVQVKENGTLQDPDPTNPRHFIRYRDRHGNYGRTLLDLEGRPHDDADSPHELEVEYYSESNFALLGFDTGAF